MIVLADDLESLVTRIFAAAGTPQDIAAYVATALVGSDLRGVESHGVARVPQYLAQIEAGWIVPAARPDVLRDGPAMAVVSANSGFGIFALGAATKLAVAMARQAAVAAVGLVDCTHTGRLGQFVEQAAAAGAIAIILGGGNEGDGRTVAPYGGLRRVLATNPYAIGVPGAEFGPIVVDIATSAAAEGKLRVHRAAGKPLPAGWIVDREGRPSTDVEDFYAGGALLPIAGHKGYGLALVAELIGRALLDQVHELNWFVIAVDIASFRAPAEFEREARRLIDEVKQVPPAPGFAEVMIPGEIEAREEARRRATGIPLPDTVWQGIREAAENLGVDASIAEAPAS